MEHVHLHVHSDASLKDGLGPVSRLVGGASSIQAPALALTDHGSLANAISFSINCDRAGIKPILGLEGYVSFDNEIGHITLLADGQRGWENLVAINNAGHASQFKQPAFSIDTLIAHQEDILCLTGCIASPLHQLSLKDAISLGSRLKMAFGTRLFAEVMFVSDQDTWTRPIRLAEELNLKTVITNDAHFPFRSDATLHPVLTSIKAGYQYNSTQLWLKSPSEMLERASAYVRPELVTEMMARTARIAAKIRRIDLHKTEHLPEIESADEKLRSFVIDCLASYDATDYITAHERAEYELSVISKMGYSSYFLILKDIVDGARSLGSLVGPGRGSGAGSFVLFLLGITRVNPLVYNLPFERFLNPERKGMPDVDVDFDSDHRQEVVEYASRQWGAMPVATYAHFSHKTLIHDLSKFFKVSREAEAAAVDGGPDSKATQDVFAAYPIMAQAYAAFGSQIKNTGKHAGGVIVTEQVVPVQRAADNKVLVAAWTEGDEKELSYAGIVKFDLLGLSALSVLNRLQNKFGIRAPAPIDNDPCFKLFRRGDLAGIFQFSGSPGIIEYTKSLQPHEFEDLVAINALYRPGALDVGSAQKYPEWKKTPRVVHPLIAEILAPTYGAIVYQEQVMAIYSKIVGGTLGDADNARRVIVKSKAGDPEWEAKMMDMQSTFIMAAAERGMKPQESKDLWHELAAHSRYSFNRAHAVSYAWIAWEMAWWKWYYPADFYAEMLNIDPQNSHAYVYDAVAHGIEVVMPDVNTSGVEYVAADKKVYMPLSSIKFMGQTGAIAIVKAREEGPFTSLEDFMARIQKKQVRGQGREGLWALGGFDRIPGEVKALAVKVTVRPIMNRATQKKYLGFSLPDKAMVQRIHAAKMKGLVAGIVVDIEEKESQYGKYHVYRVSPAGACWSRDDTRIEVGDYVEISVKKNSGKILKVVAHE